MHIRRLLQKKVVNTKMSLDPREFQVYGLLNAYEYMDLDNIQPTLTNGYGSNKKNLSAYALFFKEHQTNIREQYPGATFGQVSKIIAAKWESLADNQKKIYRDRIKHNRKEKLTQKAMEEALRLFQNSG